MNLISVAECAAKWGVAERTVRNYCAHERIPGAVLKGKTWWIPEDAERPERINKRETLPKTLLERLQPERKMQLRGGIYHKLQVDMTYNSNHIEGSRLTHDQTRYIYETNTIGLDGESVNVDDVVETAKLCKLTTPQIQKFYNQLGKSGHTVTRKNKDTGKTVVTKEPLSSKSIKNIHCILSKALNVAVEVGYIKDNPASKTKLPKIERKEIKPLTDEQVRDFIKELESEEYGHLFKVILFTGLRESEAIGLTWDCIDFDKGVLKINKQIVKRPVKDGGYMFGPLKNDKARMLTVSPFVIDILKARRAQQVQERFKAGDIWEGFKDTKEQKTALVFTSPVGGPLNPKVVYLHYKKNAARIGAPESRVHDLRHTYAVLSLQNGDDVKTVQENLGHATAAFTLDVYGHVSEKMKEESARKQQAYIDNLLNEKKA